MTDRLDFESRLEERLRARAAVASRPFDAAEIARKVVAVNGRRRSIGWLAWPSTRPALVWLVVALLAIALLGAVAGIGALLEGRPPVPASVVSNGWIAYSTGGRLPGSTDTFSGSDIYLVREGGEPRLIAAREGGSTRNVCPTFSPDGRRLAFGAVSNQGRAIVVMSVDVGGRTGELLRIQVPGNGAVACPRWSSDGTRLGYLHGGSVVVRALDGSTPISLAGDPREEDFAIEHEWTDPVVSPEGERIVRTEFVATPDGECRVVLSNRDGTDAQVLTREVCPFLIPAWSPDGRKVLLLQDVSGRDFTMWALAVDSPFEMTVVESDVRVNGARGWPGWGDVSWQPIYK